MDAQKTKAGETPLRESLEKLITKSSAPIIISSVNTGNIQFANSTAVDMYGYPYKDFIGMDISRLLHENVESVNLQKAFLNKQGTYRTDPTIHKDNEGNTFAAEFLALPMKYRDEKSVLIEVSRVKK